MIDEKKLIEDCKKYLEGRYTFQIPLEYSIAMTRLCEIIEAQPKLSLETKTSDKWIPCSDRLPSDTAIHEVTAQFSNGRIYTEFAYYDESREEWWKFDDDGIVNVIAWKEHSQPYKGEEK